MKSGLSMSWLPKNLKCHRLGELCLSLLLMIPQLICTHTYPRNKLTFLITVDMHKYSTLQILPVNWKFKMAQYFHFQSIRTAKSIQIHVKFIFHSSFQQPLPNKGARKKKNNNNHIFVKSLNKNLRHATEGVIIFMYKRPSPGYFQYVHINIFKQ